MATIDNFLEAMRGQLQAQPKPSYQSDLNALPAKYRPVYKSSNPGVGGFAGGFAGDWPGMKLRKTDANPDFKYDYYNPLKRDATPNQFGSPEEEMDYNSGQGLGQLTAAATLIPGLAKQGGRMLLATLAGRDLNAARGEASNAARWMSPKVEAQAGNPAMLGDEAAQAANEAGQKVAGATKALGEAGQFGSSLDPAIDASKRLLAAKGAGATLDQLLGGARSSVDAEGAPVGPGPEEPFTAQDMSGTIRDDTRPQKNVTPADDLLKIMAGRQQIAPYEQHDSILEKIANAIFPQSGREFHAANEKAYLENQIARQGFVDPTTQARLQQLQSDEGLGRAGQLQEQGSNLSLRNSLAPAMNPAALEKLLGVGTINPKALELMTRQRDQSGLLEMLLSGGLGGGAPLTGPAPVSPSGPVVNVPKHR